MTRGLPALRELTAVVSATAAVVASPSALLPAVSFGYGLGWNQGTLKAVARSVLLLAGPLQLACRYVPAFQDNRPDSSSFSASRYQAPSAPSRDISATGQGTSSGGAEGSALLGKVHSVVLGAVHVSSVWSS